MSSGQVENSWTLRVINGSGVTVSYNVVANCLTGPMVAAAGVSTRVWLQPFVPDNYGGLQATVSCPNGTALTGGGYQTAQLEPLDSAVFPLSKAGSQAWIVTSGDKTSDTGYALCATNINADAPVTAEFKDDQAVKQVASGHYQGLVNVACPSGETLVGGGFYGTDGRLQPWSRVALTTESTHWQVAFDYVNVSDGSDSAPALYAAGAHTSAPFGNGGVGTCITIPTKWNGKVTITFSNYHHLLRIPADVIVATDGSGQIRASILSARVSQARSQPIAAEKTINPFTGGVTYVVPSDCGSPTPAINIALSALTTQLKRSVPSGQVAFGSPVMTPDHGSLTCSPVAGTQRTALFTYTQAIDATATQSVYDPNAVVGYQQAQLQQATQALGSPYTLRDTLLCPGGPQLLNATSTRATLQCAAYGVAEWPWSADQLHTLAQSLAGKTKDAAQQVLDATPGIEAQSAVIDLPSAAGGKLPPDASDITIILVRPQDTAPVIRAP
jgi:hypothetical protein